MGKKEEIISVVKVELTTDPTGIQTPGQCGNFAQC